MQAILNVLSDRIKRVAHVYDYCKGQLSQLSKDRLLTAISNGSGLIERLTNCSFLSQIEKKEVNEQLLLEEDALGNIGIELPVEFCPLSDLLRFFREERIVLLIYINSKFK